jgi:hypothetical protein
MMRGGERDVVDGSLLLVRDTVKLFSRVRPRQATP